ncbi:LacI family DNA-binding transcriptional regulator [Bifidobacterium goeldii]|uniref:LacI family DNA-binding transcriptional regulator n=1 Tax=Bifidobacterium goeldii TaxID=2306975 RepID=UPI0013DE025C|nr:LacI family DNA-binding transcriptional regulator [Bifidobacterium goeldii]
MAARAGVSAQTVSNVVRGTGNMREETRRRVEQTIQELDYRPNRSAQTLRSGVTKMLGVAIPYFDQPFCPMFVEYVARFSRERGYGLVISLYGRDIDSAVNEARRINADGWIILSDVSLEGNDEAFSQDFPIVLAGDCLGAGTVDAVMMPNVEASAYATQWLFDHGCERVGMIGASPRLFDESGQFIPGELDRVMHAVERNVDMRFRGYAQAVARNTMPLDASIALPAAAITRQEGERQAELLIERGGLPDGLFCANDAIALGVLSALNRHGIRVPDDVQVIGFDNTIDAHYMSPALTSIDPDSQEYARWAVEMLIARIEGNDEPPVVKTTAFSLVERESTR